MKQPVFLRIYLNGKLDSVKQFSAEQIVIGSNADLQLPLVGDDISPIHAVIEERDTGYYISDLGSQTGSFRNGKKVFDEALVSGDELQVGPYKIEFFIGVPKPTTIPGTDKKISPPLNVKLNLEPKSQLTMTPPPTSVKGKLADSAAVVTKQTAATAAGPSPYKPAKTIYEPSPVTVSALTNTLKSSKGNIVEVVVAWQERVIGTHHFKSRGLVTIGSSEDCTIVVPLIGMTKRNHTLLNLDQTIKIIFTPDMTGEMYKDEATYPLADLKRKNRAIQSPEGFELNLVQGEMLRLGLYGDMISIYIRLVPETASPIAGPVLDLTASESTAVLMSAVIAAIFGLYMLMYSPKGLEEESKLEEPLRKAVVTFRPPEKKEVVVVKEDAEPQQKKIVKVADTPQQTTTKKDPGRAAEIRPSPSNKKVSQVSSAVDKGASIKTGKSAAGAKSETKDVTKLGLLSTFGGGGKQSELSKAYAGGGELIGDAEKATGFSGSAEDRAGDKLGSRLKNLGAGGKGTATVGIAGVGTAGKGTGSFGTGTGGIGKKGRVDLNIGDSEAEFSGSIDREAIRRVIRENIKLFENCYNMALRRNSDAYGKVEIRWLIQEGGRATDTKVKTNTLNDKPMGECISRVIKSLTFPEPPPDQIAEVTYPFVFASQ